jgi:hypothetical protein
VQLTLLLLVSSCWVACATTKSRVSERAATDNERSSVSGPACADGGPGVDVEIKMYMKHKPPGEGFVADLQVRNPLAVPVWFLYNVDDSFPGIVNSVVLSRTTSGPEAHLWVFSGDGAFDALRIPGSGQIVLRDVEVSYIDRDPPPALVFANRINVGGQRAEEWLGHPGLLPARGDLNLTTTPPKTEREWQVDSLEALAVHVDVLCVHRVSLPAEVTFSPTPTE